MSPLAHRVAFEFSVTWLKKVCSSKWCIINAIVKNRPSAPLQSRGLTLEASALGTLYSGLFILSLPLVKPENLLIPPTCAGSDSFLTNLHPLFTLLLSFIKSRYRQAELGAKIRKKFFFSVFQCEWGKKTNEKFKNILFTKNIEEFRIHWILISKLDICWDHVREFLYFSFSLFSIAEYVFDMLW